MNAGSIAVAVFALYAIAIAVQPYVLSRPVVVSRAKAKTVDARGVGGGVKARTSRLVAKVSALTNPTVGEMKS